MAADARATLSDTPQATADRRAALFHETPAERLERWALGTAWALKPPRIGTLPTLARVWATDLFAPKHGLPDPLTAPTDQSGLCGIVHDLSVPALVEAYRRGLYPFAHFGPLKWFSPPERCVLFFDEAHIGKNVRRALRQQRYRVTFDREFEGVIKACAGRREGKWRLTWITPRIMRTFADLYDAGHVHSFEVWDAHNALVGGGYGVAVGGAFFTESQFSHERDTSKIGFTVLNWHLARWGFALNDGKASTPTLRDFGFRNIPRAEFAAQLQDCAHAPGKTGRWEVETELPKIAEWQPPGRGPAEHPPKPATPASAAA